jgi:hypothetical protein
MGVEVRGVARYERSTARLPWWSRPTCRPDYSANPIRSPPSRQGCWETNLASSTRSECRTETTAENVPPSSADSRTLVVNRCRAGVRRLWRLVARPQVGRRPTPVRRVLAARCSLRHRQRCHRIASGPADRKVTAKRPSGLDLRVDLHGSELGSTGAATMLRGPSFRARL